MIFEPTIEFETEELIINSIKKNAGIGYVVKSNTSLSNEDTIQIIEMKEEVEKTKNEVEFCSLISARTGKCGEGCKYCSQSSRYMTSIPTHPLVSVEDVIKTAREAKQNGATRFAIVTSGRGPSDEDMPVFCEMIKEILIMI